VHDFEKYQEPITSICHGLQVPAAADVFTGKEFTGYKAIGPNLQLFGANYVEVESTEVIVDGNVGLVIQNGLLSFLNYWVHKFIFKKFFKMAR
jgi:putative intracellular protease/amidase